MGVNTDGEEMGPGSTVTDGVKLTAKACEFVQETGNEKSLPQDAYGDVGLRDQKPAKETGIPLILFPKVPLQSSVQNTEHNKAHREHTNEGDSFLSNTTTTLTPDADREGGKTELSQSALINVNTDASADDKCVKVEECSSPLQPAEIMEILETDTNDTSEAMYNTLPAEVIPVEVNAFIVELPFNPEIDKMDKERYTPLYNAAFERHIEGVQDLISRGANPNKPSKDGLRPLHAAAQEGHARIVDFLILHGADVSVECDLGRTPLHTAAGNGYVDILESFIAQGPDLNQEDDTGQTPFNAAVQEGQLEAVKYLMTQGAKQNRYDGMTPLYAAALFGHLDIVEFFISNGADVNEEDDKGRIPLHGAAARDQMEVMEYLIHQGSDVNKENNAGWTPFNAAVQNGHLEAVKYLKTEGAKQNKYDGMTPLFEAAQIGHLDLVKLFLSEGADVNEEDDAGRIPLHGAAARGHVKVMEHLIQQGSDVDKKDAGGWTPFNAAVRKGHLEAVKYLMTKGAKQTKSAGMIPVYNAAYSGHLDIVKCFISKGTDVNEEDDDGMTPLHAAAACGRMAVMEYLIEQGSDVDKKDNTGWTPLNAAARNGHLEAVKYLMSKGAKQNRYSDGKTPVYIAACCGRLDIVKCFISNGADVNEEDDEGMTPLHGAAVQGHMEVMEYLIQQGSDVNKRDCKGRTPFHAAVENGYLEVVRFLVAKGAKGTTFYGLTPLYIATQYDHTDVANFLISIGYDVNEGNDNGKSPLHAACYNGNMDIVKFLIRHNANVNEQDHDGWTPLEAAAQEGHQDIVDYLALNGADILVRDIDNLTPLRAATNTTHPHAIEGISPSRGDPDEEETGDARSEYQNIITRGYVTVTMKDGQTQLESQVDLADEGYDSIQADIFEREADGPSLKSLPTRTTDDEKGGHKECNPFIHAKLKRPDKGEQDPMLDQMEAIKCTGTIERDTITNGTDCSSPHGPQTGQYSGFDSPSLQTIETDGHPSEEPESRCRSRIDENREMRESSSPMNAGDNLPIKEPSEIESFPTHPPDLVHKKLYDGNPVSNHGTSSNPVRKIRTKRQKSVDRCPSNLAFVRTFLQMTIALAIILAGSPVLVAGRDITERVTLQAGKPGVVPFHLPLSPGNTSQVVPYYTLGFQSEPRPFCINGQPDIEGFKSPSQFSRFTTSVTDLDTSPCLNLLIDNVDTLDEGGYVLLAVWHRYENVRYKTIQKEVDVQTPPGRAKCFITLSENSDYPYEIHCEAITGSVTTTLSCYQHDQRIDIRGDITVNGLITRRIFLLRDYTHFSCCSHDVTLHVNETTCNDFEWPPFKETTMQTVNFVPTSVTTPLPQEESHTESGACRQFMMPSLWQFTYMFVYILAFVTMY